MRLILLFLLASVVSFGETFRLYMKDGDFQKVREYQVDGDRVRYFTVERGDWEEIPLALIDVARTENERKARVATAGDEAKQDAEEAQAMRELAQEIRSVPAETGAYFNTNGQVKALEGAPYQVVTNKKRTALKMLSPIPLVPGKASVVIEGEHAKFAVHDNKPTFYFRPEREESFGIVRVTPKKGHRVVENISIIPVSNQGIEDRAQIPVFQQQLADNLYKVWPEKPLEPGEYAVIEYGDNTESKDIQLLVWDFALQGATP